MTKWKIFPIGFHIGPGGNATGLMEDFLIPLDNADIRFCLKSVDAYPLDAVDLAVRSGVPHTFIWRSTSFDVPDYSLPPQVAAAKHWTSTLGKIPPEFDKRLVWIESTNEVDKNKASWLGYFAIEWTRLAWAAGYEKVLHFGWSSGEPEPEHWLTPGMADFLRLAAKNRGRVGPSIHEYSYDRDNIKRLYPWLVGRYRFLFDACDQLGIERVTTAITEWGWEYQDVPSPGDAIIDIDAIAQEYVLHPQIIGAGLWYLGPGFGNIADQAQRLIRPTGELALTWPHYVAHEWPPNGGSPPPPPPPPPPGSNMFKNGSFEQGTYKWQGVDELNIPVEWDFWYADSQAPNPIDPNPWAQFVRPEAVNPTKSNIPPSEWDTFFLDGDRVSKIFKGSGSIYFTLSQKVHLTPGAYELRMPVYADLVKGYTSNGEKIWADDPDGRDGLARIGFGTYRSDEISLMPGHYNHLVHTQVVETEGDYDIGVEIMLPFPLPQNGVFMDAFTLTETEEPPPPPPGGCIPTDQYTKFHILRPRTMTDAQWAYIRTAMETGVVLPNTGGVVVGYEGWSHLDAIGAIRQAVEAGYLDSRLVVVDGHLIGDGLDDAWMRDNCPLLVPYTVYLRSDATDSPFGFKVWPTNYKHVTQFFGARPDYYGQWGLPGHDGVDLRAPDNSPVFAVADGSVYRVETNPGASNYGIHVRIQHIDGWKTIYAHFKRANVVPGQQVKAGDIVGYADNTGNSSGSHLHLGLKREGYTYIDSNGEPWPHNFFDPTPYLKPLCPTCFEPVQPPPPPAGSARLGLHASADPGLSGGEADAFSTAKIDLIKVLSLLPANHVTQLANARPGVPFVIRAFLHFGGRQVSPQQFFDWTVSDVRRTVDRLKDRQVLIELHNEPNLYQEGHGVNWSNGAEFGHWIGQVLSMYKEAFQGYQFIFPGLSPGGDVNGIRYDSTRFMQGASNIIPAFDYLGVHAYWAANWPMQWALDTVDQALAMYPSKYVVITEASNNRRDTTQDNKALEYINFWRALQQRPRVFGVTYFVASASNEAWGWSNGTGEVWVGTSIPQIVGSRS